MQVKFFIRKIQAKMFHVKHFRDPFVGKDFTLDDQSPNPTGARSLLLFHRTAATFQLAGAALGDDHLRSAFAANVNLAQIVSHVVKRS
jgi:hypothetical protein